ncbi:MAG: metallophosphoesterase [Algicola sp.]|nr:metallophosphoesterase [Algicola sp.]
MSKVTWLHLSDIHFQSSTEWQANPAREALLAFLQKRFDKVPSLKPDFVTCTGDIAFGEIKEGAMEGQYRLAEVFFDDVLALCGDDKPLAKDRLFLVPGNHDVNRDEINSFAQEHSKQLAATSEKHIENINKDFAGFKKVTRDAMDRLRPYSEFIERYAKHQHDKDGRCFYTHQLEVNGIYVGIAGFNSAWSCADDTDDRRLWLAGEWQFAKAEALLSKPHLKIGLMHHPVDWLAQAERSIATKMLARDFHFFLHGHTHDAWVTESTNLTTIGAGAIGAHGIEEFGVNITQLDFSSGEGSVYLYTYSPKHKNWMIAVDPNHAPDAIWPLKLPQELILKPEPIKEEPQNNLTSQNPLQRHVTKQKLFGRDKLLNQAEQYLKQNNCLVVYGMRGNGKSVFIDELSHRAPLADKEMVRIPVNGTTNAGSLYQQLAGLLGDKRENISVPTGTIEEIKVTLEEYRRDDRAYCIWLENAHQLFDNDSFIDVELRKLLVALREILPEWYWLYELRERPVRGLVVDSESLEMPGLDRNTLKEFLLASTPTGKEPWEYKGNQIKSMYQWLGGGQGHQAHPLATHLLIEVAKGLDETPYEVLRRRLEVFEQELEDFLLNDLYNNVLNTAEQKLFSCLALYRVPVPSDHVELLEQQMKLENAWNGLNLRCLLSTNGDESKYYLHGFIAGWLRQQQGYPLEDAEYREFQPGGDVSQALIDKQRAIANCWIDSVKGRKRVSMQNINRTNEALFHVMASGDFERLNEVAVGMLGADGESVYKRVYALYQHLYQIEAPSSQQISLLEFLIRLKPEEHALYRYLGSKWRGVKGWQDKRVLENFQKATELEPDRPQYWSGYGKACLNQNLASQFLTELSNYEKSSVAPTGVDNVVLSVKADCLKATGDSESAFDLRQQQIIAGSDDPVFYADQALAYVKQDKPGLALDILELAEKNGANNNHTLNIKTHILEQSGDIKAAMALRQQQIDSGTANPAFYTDQAQAYLAENNPNEALIVLDLAEKNGAGNDFTLSIKANALDQSGEVELAFALRQSEIDNRSRHSAFYNAQAEAYLKQGETELALDVLLLAEKNGAGNDLTRNIKEKVLRRLKG